MDKELFIKQFLSEDEYIEFLKKIDKALTEGFIKIMYKGKENGNSKIDRRGN